MPKYRSLFENSIEGIGLSKGNCVVSANKALLGIFGYDSIVEFTKIPLLDHVALESREMVRDLMQKREKGLLEPSSRFEHRILRKDGQIRDLEISRTAISIEGEDLTQGTFRDITERKQAEEALHKSEQKYRSLITNIPDVVWTSDEKGNTTFISANVENIYGYSQEEIYNEGDRLWFGRIHPDDREKVKESFKGVFEEGRQLNLEYRVRRKDGEWIWIQDRSVGAYEKDGVKYADGVFFDITERKQAEEALRMSELRIRSLIEQTTDAVFCYEYDPPISTDLPIKQQAKLLYDGVLVDCNDVCAKSYGARRAQDVVGRKLTELFGTTPGSLDKLFRGLIEAGYRMVDGEGVEKLEDGTQRYYLNNGHGVIEDGKLVRVWGTFRDITERKEAEEALLKEREFTEVAINSQIDTFFVFDPTTGTPKRWNRAFCEISGYTDDEVASMKAPDDWYSQEDLIKAANATESILRGERATIEMSLITKDGRKIPTEYTASALLDEQGGTKYVVTIGRDITERKRADEALKESESRFRELVENIREVFWMENAEGTELLYVSPVYEQVWGRSCQSFYENPQSWIEAIHPDDRKRVADAFAQFRKTGTYSEEFRIVRPDGSIRWIWDRGVLIRDESGETLRVVGIAEDITERKLAGQALRQSERRFRSLSEAAFEGIAFTEEGVLVDANEAFTKIFGYSLGELKGKQVTELVAPEHRELVAENIRSGYEEAYEHKGLHKDGSLVDLEVHGRSVMYQGQRMRLTAISDITERKQAEQERRRLTAILEATSDFVSTATPDGRITYINRAGRRMIGLADDEDRIERRIAEAHPDWAFRIIENEGIPAAFERGLWRGETALLGPGGVEIPTSQVIMSHKTPEGEVEYLSTVVRDITERKRAERALRESEERFRTLFESAPDGIYLNDLEGNFVDGNKAAEELAGSAKEELVGKNFMEVGLLAPEDMDKAIANLKKNAQGEPTGPDEFTLTRKDGSCVTVEIRTFPVRIKDQMLSLGIARDVTERKQTEQALQESEARFRATFDQAAVGIAHVAPDGRFIRINQRFCDIVGYTHDEMLARTFQDITHPDDLDTDLEYVRRMLTGEILAYSMEKRYFKNDRSIVWVNLTVALLREESGEPEFFISVVEDISKRKQAEQSLREQRDRAQKYLDVAGVMFVILDVEGKVTLVNRRGCEILGYQETEIVGNDWFGSFLPERMRDTVREVFNKLMAGEIEPVEYYENPVLTKSGAERIIAWHNTILKDDFGNVVGTLSSGQDITERKEAEERAEQHQAELLRVSRLSTVGEMASGLAHELNQPLTAILTGSGLCLHNVREGVKNVDRLIENLQLIETQAERAGRIIHHLRSLIKKQDATKTPVNVNSTIREVADFMSSHIRHAEVELDLELLEQTPMVFADTIQIQQVLLNLMRNAIEAMEAVEPQTRRLTIRTSTSPDNERIEVAIRDSGEGFACDDAETLFDSFFSTKPNGLGIGLSLCRSIIEAHQGQLWAKPNPEGGSTFSFALPVAGDTL